MHGKGGDGVAAHVCASSGNGLVRGAAVAEAMKCYIARPDPKHSVDFSIMTACGLIAMTSLITASTVLG